MTKTCKKCGTKSLVDDSRDYGDRVMRKRYCPNFKCKNRWMTFEITAEQIDKWEHMMGKVEDLRKLLDVLSA